MDEVNDTSAEYNAEYSRRVLRFAVLMGETLLHNGGEIFRVQDTMERVARAFGEENFHAYVLTNGLFASVDGAVCESSTVRALQPGATHLGRIIAVNALSREIAAGKVSLDEAYRRLEGIRVMPYHSNGWRIAACAVGCGCFSYLFGGSVMDAMAGMVAGFCLEPLRIALDRANTGKVVSNLLASVWVALVSLLCVLAMRPLGISMNLDKVIIGGIIPLVPGIALTTGIRDIAGGDYLSGTIRAIDAMLIGGSIALGVGLVLKLSVLMTGVTI